MSVRLFHISEKKALFIISLFYLIGILVFLKPEWRFVARNTTDIFLFLSHSAVFIILFCRLRSNQLLAWFILVSFLTFAVEVVGIKTGLIFGEYRYADGFVFQLMDVPPVIGINWAVLILSAHGLVQATVRKRQWTPLITAVLIVLFDIILEPVAMKIDFWQWDKGIVPAQNYFVWFIIAFLASGGLGKLRVDRLVNYGYFIILSVFFGSLRVMLFI